MDQSYPPSPSRTLPAARPAAANQRQDDFGLSRRELLRLAAMATAVGLTGLSLSLSGCAGVSGRPVRREITTVDDATIASYKKAITAMKNLPSTNPRSWSYQANLHYQKGILNPPVIHHNWLFLPWHRAFLHSFEQICREMSGDATFALPYWNWTKNPAIPNVFLSPADASNPLYDSKRTASSTFPSWYSSAVAQSEIDQVLQEPNFLVFAGLPPNSPKITDPNTGLSTYLSQGVLEATPHNSVHGYVGDNSDDMGLYHSPLDPLFWVHHARVDELWVEWNILKGNNNTNDSAWWSTEFTEFVDGQGNPVTVSVLGTVLMPLLNYQYDTQ
jgi:tyrosinase